MLMNLSFVFVSIYCLFKRKGNEDMKYENKTALLIIDMQRGATVRGGRNFYETNERLFQDGFAEKVDEMRRDGCLIVHVYTSGEANGLTSSPHSRNPELTGRNMRDQPTVDRSDDIDERIHIEESDIILRKFTYSAFWGTPLLRLLQQKGVENVLISGEKTNVCCRQTAIDAVSHCFKTYVIEDMTATNNDEIKQYHLDEFNRYFAKVLNSEEVIKRLKNKDF